MIALLIVLVVAVAALGILALFQSEDKRQLKQDVATLNSRLNDANSLLDGLRDEAGSLRIALTAERNVSKEAKALADLRLSQYEDVVAKHNALVDAQTVTPVVVEKVEPCCPVVPEVLPEVAPVVVKKGRKPVKSAKKSRKTK